MEHSASTYLFIRVLTIVICFLVYSGVIVWATGIAGISNRSFPKALAVIILTATVSYVASSLIGENMIIRFVVSVFVFMLIIKAIFKATFGEAILTTFVAYTVGLAASIFTYFALVVLVSAALS